VNRQPPTSEAPEALTPAIMRADVARALGEPPEGIGEHDDLADLGLDSMRAMALLLRWNERGLGLDFGEFAERLTLAAWWTIVQRQQARGPGA